MSEFCGYLSNLFKFYETQYKEFGMQITCSSGLSLTYRAGGCIKEVDDLCPSKAQIFYGGKWVVEHALSQS